MRLVQLYYFVKPVLPWHVRLSLRRWRAAHRRRVYANVWPIDSSAGNTPPNWPGWPEGKRFAFVLTHDVEERKGLARVEQLMKLELKHGFQSCFNFVPEGNYRLSSDMREKLRQSGFEVGIHGLEHDGKLYNSKSKFAAKAARIREYLRLWKVSGFRSPLMQHNLSWLHELGLEYDSSTFDTDPFEPQSDGAGTIFPFWVPNGQGGGYVELPYTLIQDFNLFVVLREKNIDVWRRKLDWVAEQGGMVLLNTHPDYMCFEGITGRDEYPVAHYEELLRYVREKHQGAFWATQPKEVARYYRDSVPAQARNTRRKICMVAYTFYEYDNRVRRYAETLARRGDQVDIIALRGGQFSKPVENINGVTVHRIQGREYNEPHKWVYAWRLSRFLIKSSFILSRLHERNRYDVIHVHNMPDFLVFAAWYPKLTGAKIILDVHDMVPELFANKFQTSGKSAYVSWLKLVEKWSAKFADHVIVSNHLWRETLLGRSVPPEKCSVFVNHVDPAIFYRRPRTRNDGKFIILFPGSLQWHQGLDIAIQAFVHVKQEIPNAEFHIYSGGGGHMRPELIALAARLGLAESVKFFEGVPLDQIPQIVANADLGVVPKRADSFGNEAYSTKIMEFMSQGVPVVASRTRIDEFYFGEGIVHFFKSGNSAAMAQAMLEVINNQALRERLIAHGLEYAERNGWMEKRQEYLDLVDSLSTERFEKSSSHAADIVRQPHRVSASPANHGEEFEHENLVRTDS